MSQKGSEEKSATSADGMTMLLLNCGLMAVACGGFVAGLQYGSAAWSIALLIVSSAYLFAIGPLLLGGLKVLKPNEALVLTLFGRYFGTLRGPGFFFVNPFVSAVCPPRGEPSTGSLAGDRPQSPVAAPSPRPTSSAQRAVNRRISLKAMTLSNDRQKVNDALGNPVIIGINVVWRVTNTARALFDVDNYVEFLSIQCDTALRNIVRLYPYDASDEEGEKSLRGSSQEIAESLRAEIQRKVEVAGLEILEARITHLSYAPEIAAAMLQRQQATAIIAARQMIVEGAVGMVEMALDKLSERHVVDLDEERKAAMVSNLLVVLCGNKEAQPIVNSGSIY